MVKVKRIVAVGLMSLCLATVPQVGSVPEVTQASSYPREATITTTCYAYKSANNSAKIKSRYGYYTVEEGQTVTVKSKSGKFYKVEEVEVYPGNGAENVWLENVYIPRACLEFD